MQVERKFARRGSLYLPEYRVRQESAWERYQRRYAPLRAAIAFDAVSNSGAQTATSYSWTHTPVGTPTAVTVCTGAQGSTDASRLVSSITYGGTNLVLVKREDNAATENITAEIWALANPASGAQTVVVTFVGTIARSAAGAITWTGSDTTTATEANNGAQGTGAGPTVNVTSVSDNAWAVDSLYVKSTTNPTAGANQTQRVGIAFGSQSFMVSTEGPQTPAGAITMSWSGTAAWVLAAAVIKPAAAAVVTPPLPMLVKDAVHRSASW